MEFNATFIVSAISFIIFVVLMNIILYAPLQKVVEERKKRPFTSIEDLQKRAKISQTLIERMKKMKILDGLDESDQLSLF